MGKDSWQGRERVEFLADLSPASKKFRMDRVNGERYNVILLATLLGRSQRGRRACNITTDRSGLIARSLYGLTVNLPRKSRERKIVQGLNVCKVLVRSWKAGDEVLNHLNISLV